MVQTLYTMVAILVAVMGLGTMVSAADCEVPTFLATGKTYKFALGFAAPTVTVIEIDQSSCWLKGQSKMKSEMTGKESTETLWFNVRQILAIEEVPSSPTKVQPKQRR
jgi:hypothetical protein